MANDDHIELGIAIVGMAGRFPGAPSVEALWRNLRSGVESIRDLSEDELRASGSGALLGDPRFVRRAADVSGADLFDAALFGITPREAEITDPQFRVFLEDAWTALEDAGRLSDHGGERVGVFAGGSPETYLLHNVMANGRAARAVGEFQTSLGNQRDYLATQISYRLDLRGPSLTVQTACSTSLVAVHLACQSLLARECDTALAGGVSIGVPQTSGYLYEEGGIASPDGRCRAFDAAAAGCVKGNGSAIVVLRRLEDALRDGDRIRAVIRGSAVNNDGSAKVGFTAPSEDGQASVVAEALAAAGVSPETVSYVEAHGTGTLLGDPIEIAALARAWKSAGETASDSAARVGEEEEHEGRTGPVGRGTVAGAGADVPAGTRCAIGSIKTNIGHLDAAAGAAGLVKTVLMLEHREIAPSLHLATPNPRIGFESTPFHVAARLAPWPEGPTPRRAGVSSFGIGGTNAHVVVEQAPDRARQAADRIEDRPRLEDRTPHEADDAALLVISAATEEALAASCAALAERLASDGAPDLRDAAYTLQTGRRRLRWRRALVVRERADAAAALREHDGGRVARGGQLDERRHAQVAFLFPGQGAQRPGMARGLYEREPVFREAFDACAAILNGLLGTDLAAAVFSTSSADALRETSLAQPALFAVEQALARLWISWGVTPCAVAGHSVGEYVAACVAGVMSVEDAARLVAARARLMSAAPRGSMLATTLREEDLVARLSAFPALSIAAVNGPSATVASGPESEIARLEAALASEGLASRRLVTSHAFHSATMDAVLAPFEDAVRAARLSAPVLPIASNVTGTWMTAAQATDPSYWSSHVRRTVRFGDDLALLAEDPSRVLLEVGPGAALTSLAKRLGRGPTLVASLPHVDGRTAVEASASEAVPAKRPDAPARIASPAGPEPPVAPARRSEATDVLEALGALWCAGVDVDWESVHAARRPTRASLPTYPFERRRFWIDPPDAGETGSARADGSVDAATAPAKDPDLARWFYVPGWTRSIAVMGASTPGAEPAAPRSWLVLSDGSALAQAVIDLATARGARVVTVRAGSAPARKDDVFTIDPVRREHHESLFRDLKKAGAWPGTIVNLWSAHAGAAGKAPADRGDEGGFWSMLALLQGLGAAGSVAGVRVLAVAHGLFDVAGETVVDPERALLIGLCRVSPQEYPGLVCRLVDVGGADAAGAIAAESDAGDREPVVAWRGGHRWIPSYTRVRLEAPSSAPPGIRADGVYAITGGAGALSQALARRLAASGAKAVLLLECPGEGEPLGPVRADLPSGGDVPRRADDDAAARARASADGPDAIASLRALGAEIVISGALATDAAAVGAALGRLRARFGRVDAVFHVPGAIGGGMIQLKEREAASRVLAPRVSGTRALAASLREDERLVLFSSAVSATGVFGQVDYCAASAFQDAFAHADRGPGAPRVIAIDWGTAHWDRWQTASETARARSDTSRALGGPEGDALLAQLQEIQETTGISVDEGVDALWRALVLERPQVVVSPQPLEDLVAQATSFSATEFLESMGGAARAAGEARRDGREIAPTVSETERRVAELWGELLGVAPIGRNDNFFGLGGNSLLAIQLASQLRAGFDIDLTIASLFESADLAGLAAAVDLAIDERRQAEEVARLLAEIESLSDDEVRRELAGGEIAAPATAKRATEPERTSAPATAKRATEPERASAPATAKRATEPERTSDNSESAA